MKYKFISITIIFAICQLHFANCFSQNAVGSQTRNLEHRTSNPLRGNGMSFTQNNGQIIDTKGNLRPDILYKGSGGGADVYLRKTGMSYVLSNVGEVMHEVDEQVAEMERKEKLTSTGNNFDKQKVKEELLQKQSPKVHRIDFDFIGINQNINILTNDRVEGYANYYLGHCPQGITNVNSYNEVIQKNIYNNIDVKYYGGKEKGFKYDIVVNPGGNPNDIKLKYSGADELIIKNGELKIKNSIREITEQLPKVYQNINGKIVDVKTEYRLEHLSNKDVIVHFSFSTFNSSFPLVVDPYWATYCGGSAWEVGMDLATDNIGNVLISGTTTSVNFPAFAGFQIAYRGGNLPGGDVFVAKLNSSGALLWSTYYGGSANELAPGVVVDKANNVIITGYTASTNFPVYAGFQMVHGGGYWNAFVVKFSATGNQLWATYYGDDGEAFDVATDSADNIVITGFTGSNFPVLAGFQMASRGGSDSFVVKLNSSGVPLWATFYGGSLQDSASGIFVDSADNIVISGSTTSRDLPVSASAFQMALAGSLGYDDVFIVKFSPAGARLWATYCGGSNIDDASGNSGDSGGIAIDNGDNIIISGLTMSSDFPVYNGFQMAFGGGPEDAFVVKLNSSGALLWATYYGGNQWDWGWGIVTDANNNVYLLMEAEDIPTPTLVDACTWQPVFNGGYIGPYIPSIGLYLDPYVGFTEDQVVVKFSPAGQKLCATYVGGIGEDDMDQGGGIAIYRNSIFTTGCTDGGYPVTQGTFQTVYGGGWDAFVASLCTNICEGKILGLDYTASNINVCSHTPVTFTPAVSNACDTTGYKFQWMFPGGNPSSSAVPIPTVLYYSPGTYTTQLILTTPCKKDTLIKTTYIKVNSCGCTLSAQASTTANLTCGGVNNGSVRATVSAGSGGPYTYTWSNGVIATTTSTSNQLNNLTAGSYTVTINDGACMFTSTVTVTQPLQLNSISSTKPTCNGGSNGSATVSISGPGGPYTYSWSNGVNAITTSSTHQLNNLPAGTYTVTVMDNSCTTISSVTITAPPALFAGGMPQWTSCTSNGAEATVITDNGTPPYTFLWNTGKTTAAVKGLGVGTYYVTVTDAAGCTTSTSVIVTPPPPIQSYTSSKNITCYQYAEMWVMASGVGTLTYNWSNGLVGPYVKGVAAGIYIVTITDKIGCTATQIFNISGSTSSSVDASFTQSPTGTICAGTTVNFINTGSQTDPEYIAFQWSVYGTGGYDLATVYTNAFSYTFLTPGTYNIFHQVKKSLSNFCLATTVSTVTVIDCTVPVCNLAGQFTKGTANCASCGCKEWVMVNATGGTSPYSYTWPDGYDKRYKNHLCPGAYTINIKDKNGCSINLSLTAP